MILQWLNNCIILFITHYFVPLYFIVLNALNEKSSCNFSEFSLLLRKHYFFLFVFDRCENIVENNLFPLSPERYSSNKDNVVATVTEAYWFPEDFLGVLHYVEHPDSPHSLICDFFQMQPKLHLLEGRFVLKIFPSDLSEKNMISN